VGATTQEWKELKNVNLHRVYVYRDGSRYGVENIVRMSVSSSGTHYLEGMDGSKYIVAPGWVAIELTIDGPWNI
jgi:hypothetical protein